jgi:hypothetical protein
MPHNLISAQESPVPLPKFYMASRLKILISSGSKKGTRIYYPFFSQKVPASESPPGSTNGAPRERDARLQGIFTSLWIYLLLSFSQMFSQCSLTESSRTGILRHQSHWLSERILFIHSLIHSCMSARVPKKEPSYIHTYRKNIRSTSTEPHADWRPIYNGVRPGSPRASLTTLLSLSPCHAGFGTIPFTLAWVDQSLVSQRVS